MSVGVSVCSATSMRVLGVGVMGVAVTFIPTLVPVVVAMAVAMFGHLLSPVCDH